VARMETPPLTATVERSLSLLLCAMPILGPQLRAAVAAPMVTRSP
jgi:hypothetical protein